MTKVHRPKIVVNSPGPSDRLLIVGRTGSGKSVAELYHLSRANFDQMPWVIVDSKGEEAFTQIRGVIDWEMQWGVPNKPGLYIIRPLPDERDEVETWLWKVHARGNVGLCIDEGYMIAPFSPKSPAFRAILTQGRSLRIPVIINTQRPKWLEPFAVSEATFYQVFHLNDRKDRQRVQEFIDKDSFDLDERLPNFQSVYHDVKENQTHILKPVRPAEESILLIDKRLDVINKTQNTAKFRAV